MVLFKNLHKNYSLEKNFTDSLESIFNNLLKAHDLAGGEVNLVFADNILLKKLNCKYRNKNKPTDVLSFDFLNDDDPMNHKGDEFPVGDIFVSVDLAKKQAAEAGHSLERELAQLAIHGFLHLLGYDHDSKLHTEKMKEKERALLLSFEYIQTGEI